MRYYVNKNAQSNGDHEVHLSTCSWLPDASNRIYLGDFDKSQDALEARKYYFQVDGCMYCCPEIHHH